MDNLDSSYKLYKISEFTPEGYIPIGLGADSFVYKNSDNNEIIKVYKNLLQKCSNDEGLLAEVVNSYSHVMNSVSQQLNTFVVTEGIFEFEGIPTLDLQVTSEIVPVRFNSIDSTISSPFIQGPNLIDLLGYRGIELGLHVGASELNEYFAGEHNLLCTVGKYIDKSMEYNQWLKYDIYRRGVCDQIRQVLPLSMAQKFHGTGEMNVKCRFRSPNNMHLIVTDLFPSIYMVMVSK